MRRRYRAWLARHENLFTALWYLHLVRNEDPGQPPWWLPWLQGVALVLSLAALCLSAAVMIMYLREA